MLPIENRTEFLIIPTECVRRSLHRARRDLCSLCQENRREVLKLK